MREKRWRDVPTLTERQRALCEVAEKLSATPTRMVERDWQPLRELGFGDEGCLEVDEPKGVVKGEHTRRQSENDRRVSAHDGVEIAAIVRVHLDARARRPHLEKLVVDRDPDRR